MQRYPMLAECLRRSWVGGTRGRGQGGSITPFQRFICFSRQARSARRHKTQRSLPCQTLEVVTFPMQTRSQMPASTRCALVRYRLIPVGALGGRRHRRAATGGLLHEAAKPPARVIAGAKLGPLPLTALQPRIAVMCLLTALLFTCVVHALGSYSTLVVGRWLNSSGPDVRTAVPLLVCLMPVS